MSTERIRVLVTGGCGFLGTEIVSALLATRRFDITAIDINPPALGTTTFTQDVRYVRANVMDRDALQKVFDEAKPAIVVHTVGVYRLGTARYSLKNKEGEFTINVEGTRNVVEASKECGSKGLVYTSSVTVVLDELGKDFKNVDEEWPTGRAKTSYGQSKVRNPLSITAIDSKPLCLCRSRRGGGGGGRPADIPSQILLRARVPHMRVYA